MCVREKRELLAVIADLFPVVRVALISRAIRVHVFVNAVDVLFISMAL